MICEICGKEHDGTFGSGRFCSKQCANTRKHSKDVKAKIANTLKGFYKDKRKINICKICGSEYYKGEKCKNEFCEMHKHNIQHFQSLIKYFGFDKNKLGTFEVENEFNKIRNTLYDMYWNKEMSSTEICKIFNYPSASNLTNKLFKNILFIPAKSCKQCIKENYLHGRLTVSDKCCTLSNQQWHTTWNNKEVYLRSSYELDYAKELDENQIDYEVENLRIKYWDSQKEEFRCAIPDFYIPSENLIVEIKSNYTLDKQNMIDKKKAYIEQGYNFKLICDHIELKL